MWRAAQVLRAAALALRRRGNPLVVLGIASGRENMRNKYALAMTDYFRLENLCYTLPMPIIRASEIGSYLYCRRAWHYRKRGVESANQTELAAGTELHLQHGRKALASSLSRTLGLLLFLAAIALLVAYCTAQL